MSKGDWRGTGGLWLRTADNFNARDKSVPRWTGSWTCSKCGHKDQIAGFGSDQRTGAVSSRAPTISLRRNNRDG